MNCITRGKSLIWVIGMIMLAACNRPGQSPESPDAKSPADAQTNKTRIQSVPSSRSATVVIEKKRTSAHASATTGSETLAVEAMKTISAYVRLADGQPLPGTTVTVRTVTNWGIDLETFPVVSEAVTNDAGSYQLHIPERSACVVEARKPGYGSIGLLVHEGVVREQLATQLSFTLSLATILEGQVVDPHGRPIGGSVVKGRLRKPLAGGDMNLASNQVTTTSVDGRFRIDMFAASDLLLVASAQGHGFVEKIIKVPDSDHRLLLPGGGGIISGRVIHKLGGTAVPGAKVEILTAKKPNELKLLRGGISTTADADGNYRLENLSWGRYTIRSEAPGLHLFHAQNPEYTQIDLNDQATSKSITLNLFSGYTIAGTTRDRKTSTPLSGVRISGAHETRTTSTVVISDSNGRFEITGLLPHPQDPKMTALMVEYPGYTGVINGRMASTGNAYVPVVLPQNGFLVEQDLILAPLLRVTGTVKTMEGMPVTSAQVSRVTGSNMLQQDPALGDVLVDGAGKFELRAPAFSSFLVKADAEGYPESYSKLLSTKDKDLTGTELIMKPGAKVRGIVQSPDGKPLAGATVTANWSASDNTGDSKSKSPAKQITGSGGAFALEMLPPKQIMLGASAEAYLSSDSVSLTLAPGETTTGILLVLDTPHFVAGQVADMNDKPLAGIQVLAAKPEKPEVAAMNLGVQLYSHTTSTDSNGRYHFDKLRAGQVLLSTQAEDYMPEHREVPVDQENVNFKLRTRKVITLSGRVVDSKTGQPVQGLRVEQAEASENQPKPELVDLNQFLVRDLREGSVANLRLSAPGYINLLINESISGEIELLEKSYKMTAASTITGRVLDKANRTPIPNVLVEIGGSSNSQYQADRVDVQEARTDSGGRFQLNGAGTGNVTVRFKPPDSYVRFTRDAVCEPGNVAQMGDILLDSGGSLSGRVVRVPGDEPLKNTVVNLTGSSRAGEPGTSVQKSATTDGDGHFRFTGLSNMMYSVSVAETENSIQVMLEASDHKTVTIQVGSATLNGTVLRAGKPVAGQVHLSKGAYAAQISRAARTDETGKFTLTGLNPGKWNVMINSDNRSNHYNTEVEIPETGTVNTTFVMPSGQVVGVVLTEDGRPAANATVTAKGGPAAREAWNNVLPYDYSRGVSARSGADGRFSIADVPPGQYTLKAKLESASASVSGVDVPLEGETALVTLQLKPLATGTLESTALNMSTGGPIKEAWCMLWSGTEKLDSGSIKRNDDGVVTIPDIPVGEYKVQVSSFGFAVSERMVAIEAGKTTKIEDVLYDAGAVRFSVQDKNSSPIGEVMCTLTSVDPKSIEPPRQGTTDRSGLWVVRGLFPGTYIATANASGHNPGKGSVDVQAHQAVDLILKLE